jgi:hypothetical protein
MQQAARPGQRKARKRGGGIAGKITVEDGTGEVLEREESKRFLAAITAKRRRRSEISTRRP